MKYRKNKKIQCIIILLFLLNLILIHKSADAMPETFHKYPESSKLATMINPDNLQVNYFHEDIILEEPLPGAVVNIDLTDDNEPDIQFLFDKALHDKCIYIIFEDQVKKYIISGEDESFDWKNAQEASVWDKPIDYNLVTQSNDIVTINNPENLTVNIYHQDISISSPEPGVMINVNIIDNNEYDLQLIFDAAASGKTFYIEYNNRVIKYIIPDEDGSFEWLNAQAEPKIWTEPDNYKKYPQSSMACTLINPDNLNVNYYHEYIDILSPKPGAVINIDLIKLQDELLYEIQLVCDEAATDKIILIEYNGIIKKFKPINNEYNFDWQSAEPNTIPIASDYTAICNNFETCQFNLTASDNDNDPLKYFVHNNVQYGNLTILNDNQAAYTPAESEIDQFTYFVNDGYDDSNIATVKIQLYGYPAASTEKALSGYITNTNIVTKITGDYVISYKYKLNQNQWSQEFSIDKPIILNSLEDKAYTLLVIGKNQVHTWQNINQPSVFNWIIDSNVDAPEITLPSEFDTGKNNNDQITNLTQLTITGTCENDSILNFYNNNKFVNKNTKCIKNEFNAIFNLTHGNYNISATQTDIAGNISQSSNSLFIQVDTDIDDFEIFESDFFDNNKCLWALEPENISITGTRELDSDIFLECNYADKINISYPENNTWKADLINMPTGQYTVLIHATDIAGNTSTIEKNINRPYPFAKIESSGNELLADGESTLNIVCSFYLDEDQEHELCVREDIQLLSSIGEINDKSFENNALVCKLKAGIELGDSNIELKYKNKILKNKIIKMIPGDFEKLVFISPGNIQPVNSQRYWFELKTQDAYGHDVAINNEIYFEISSDAGKDGSFYYFKQQSSEYEWKDERITKSLKPEESFIFQYKTSVCRNVKLNASDIINKNIKGEFDLRIFCPEFTQESNKKSESYTSVNIELNLSNEYDQDYIVKYMVSKENSSAKQDSDYILPDSQEVKFNAGESKGFINFQIINDYIAENNEEIIIRLEATQKEFRYIIEDDDNAGIVINNSQYELIENEALNYSIVLKSQPEDSVSFSISVNNDNNDNNNLIDIDNSYFTIQPENFNNPQLITVKARDDEVYRGNVNIEVKIDVSSNDFQYNSILENFNITIVDNDEKPKAPTIYGLESPCNNNNPEFLWKTGGGTEKYRYRFDNNNLDKAEETAETSFQPSYELIDGYHTFYVQEYNEYSKKWSESDDFNIEIDTGTPCSRITKLPSYIDAQNMTFEISYDFDDIYDYEKCWDTNNEDKGSGLKTVELWYLSPESSEYTKYTSDTEGFIDGKFKFTVDEDNEGAYRFISIAIDKAGNKENIDFEDSKLNYIETVFAKNFSGYAVLSVGSVGSVGSDNSVEKMEGIFSHTLTADNIYQHLINRHFGLKHDKNDPLDHIKYFNPLIGFNAYKDNPGYDPFKNYAGEVVSYKEALQSAIEEWTFNKMKILPGPLYIILINHGGKEEFYLTGTSSESNLVLSSDLNIWIEKLEKQIEENNIKKHDIVIVIGTCYSGSFIDNLSKPGRIIITSSAANEKSFRGPSIPLKDDREGSFFTNILFNELAKDKSLSESFIIAVQRIERLTAINNKSAPYFDFAAQHPLLDDSADSKGSNTLFYSGDGFRAQYIMLGHNITPLIPVEIDETSIFPDRPLETDENTFTFNVKINNKEKAGKVWIEIRKPGDELLPCGSMQNQFDLEQISLSYDEKLSLYSVEHDSFNKAGKYTIFFYVQDTNQVISNFYEAYLYKKKLNNNAPEKFELIRPFSMDDFDNNTELTKVIFEWEKAFDPDGDKITYTLFISKDKDFKPGLTIIKKEISETNIYYELPGDYDNKEIYWKVAAIDEFGDFFESRPYRFKTDNTNDITRPIAFFQVYDKETNLSIPNAVVSMKSINTTIDFTTTNQGSYILMLENEGSYEITAQAANYKVTTTEINFELNSKNSITLPLEYKYEIWDISKNGKIDIGDVILCLKMLSKINDFKACDFRKAQKGDVVKLSDVIYVLQKISDTF